MTGAERREHERYDIQLGAEITTGERSFTAATRDISAGGACVEAAHPLPEEATINVALFVVVDGIEDADFPPLSLRARVQWTAQTDDEAASWQHLAGLRFEEMTESQQQWLAGVVNKIGDSA